MARHYSARGCTFALVYILEAHASDEWPVAMSARDVPQHRGLEDRLAAARAFHAEYSLPPELPLFADGPNDEFNSAYASWPFRFWALTASGRGEPIVALKPMPVDASYDVGELESWLDVNV